MAVTPKIHRDARGFFSEAYNATTYAEAGIDATFVQDNHSLSVQAGVVRGLHFQVAPHAQGKLVRVARVQSLDASRRHSAARQ
ncbi:MAG: dTDP-4-keto-6-deoxy-D-glucose epimerase, partial [Verrucomicrobiae bacterium]|nr:dTDP-4-keto-6-deoxy-D-glucose epimerase [Verrucomicrobiae bacterium]